MNGEMLLAFAELSKKFSNAYSADECTFCYRAEKSLCFVDSVDEISAETAEQMQGICAAVGFEGYRIYLIYDQYTAGYMPSSILSMRISFNRDRYSVKILSYELLPYITHELCDLGCTLFPSIESPEKLSNCFKCLEAFYEKHRRSLDELASDDEKLQPMLEEYRKRMSMILGRDVFLEMNRPILSTVLSMYDSFEISRYVTGAYSNFLKGKYKKAEKQLIKYKYKSPYEFKVLEFIRSLPAGAGYNAYAVYGGSEDASSELYSGVSDGRTSFTELMVFYAGSMLSIPLLILPYLLLYFVFSFAMCSGFIYYSGYEPYNAAFIMLPVLFTAIPMSFYMRRAVYKFFFRKKRKMLLQYDSITTTPGTKKTFNVLLNVMIVISIIFTMFSANTGIGITDKGIIDKSEFFDLRGTLYEWNEIDSVWMIEGRTNSLGEWLDNPSYVILLKSGEKLDLYENLEYKDAKEKMEPYFRNIFGKINRCYSIDDISKSKLSSVPFAVTVQFSSIDTALR